MSQPTEFLFCEDCTEFCKYGSVEPKETANLCGEALSKLEPGIQLGEESSASLSTCDCCKRTLYSTWTRARKKLTPGFYASREEMLRANEGKAPFLRFAVNKAIKDPEEGEYYEIHSHIPGLVVAFILKQTETPKILEGCFACKAYSRGTIKGEIASIHRTRFGAKLSEDEFLDQITLMSKEQTKR